MTKGSGIVQPRERAFTVIELLVVIVLISLIVSASGGMYVGTYRNMQVRRSARELLLAAKYARTFAIENQVRVTLELVPAERAYVLTAEVFDNGQAQQRQISDLYSRPSRLAEGVEFERIHKTASNAAESAQQSGSSIVFLPDGSAESAIVQLGDSQRHYTISINPATGMARVHVGSAETVEPQSIDLDLDQTAGGLATSRFGGR